MNNPNQPQIQPKYVMVEINFLQSLLNYLKNRPYEEVFTYIDILTGKATANPPLIINNNPVDPQESNVQNANIMPVGNPPIPEHFKDR